HAKAAASDSAAAESAAQASARAQARAARRGRSAAKARGHRDEFVTMDMGFDAAAPAPEHQPGARASDCGAGPIGFAGTVRKEAVVKAAGLTTLAGDDFGGGPTMPMMPGTWTHDQGVFDEHR
ncbi:PPW family C-terminal domain-containing PPE protein, partial [Mycobacterium tuberculosis]